MSTKLKRYGESGHPWRSPLVCENIGEVTPESLTLNLGLEYKEEIESLNKGGIPKCIRAAEMDSKVTESKALDQ